MVALVGAEITKFGRSTDGTGFRDWAVAAFAGALARSGLGPDDIDTLVLASESDVFTLQLNLATVLAQDPGPPHVASFRIEAGGAAGQQAVQAGRRGFWRVWRGWSPSSAPMPRPAPCPARRCGCCMAGRSTRWWMGRPE